MLFPCQPVPNFCNCTPRLKQELTANSGHAIIRRPLNGGVQAEKKGEEDVRRREFH